MLSSDSPLGFRVQQKLSILEQLVRYSRNGRRLLPRFRLLNFFAKVVKLFQGIDIEGAKALN